MSIIEASPKPTRRRVAKGPSRQGPDKQKVAVYLSPENARRLGVASVMEGRSQSAIVDDLLAEALRGWVVSDRAKSADQAMPVESTDQAS